MGRKRMAETTLNQDKTSNDCSETTIAVLEKHSHSSCADASEAVNTGNIVYSDSNVLSPKKCKTQAMDVVVRRSCRLMNSVPRAERLQMKVTTGHVNIYESKGEETSLVQQAKTGPILNERVVDEELPHVQQVVTTPILNQKTMEAEIPHAPSVGTVSIVNEKSVVDKFEFLAKVFGEFVSKTDKQVRKALNEEDSSTGLNYKSLYISSQKRIEGLMEENFHLSRKLEFALGKSEAYEKMMGAMCASKEVVLFPSPPLKKHVSRSLAAPLAVNGHETSSPKPKKRTCKKKMQSLDVDV